MYFPDLIEEYKHSLKDLREMGGNLDMQRDLMVAIKWMETGYDPAEYRAATRTDALVMDPYHMQTYMAYVNDDEMLIPEFLGLMKDKIEGKFVGGDLEAKEWQGYANFIMRDLNSIANKANQRKEKINSALKGLTAEERAVYVAIEGELMSFGKVAKMLDVSKSTVQSYYERACRKIHSNITHGTQVSIFDDIA